MDAMGNVFFFTDRTMVNLFMIPGFDENTFSWQEDLKIQFGYRELLALKIQVCVCLRWFFMDSAIGFIAIGFITIKPPIWGICYAFFQAP